MSALDKPSSVISMKNIGVNFTRRGHLFRRKDCFEALKSVNLEVFQGETLGVLGRNGSGKSTLLQVMSGVLMPDSGSITHRCKSVSLLRLNTGFDYHLTGRDNAVLSGMIQGATRDFMESKCDEIKDYSELGEFYYQPINTYSSGMLSRLGFSISIMLNPDVLLVDEVLSVGDKEFKEKAEKTMTNRMSSGQTVVFVSHSLEQISRLCDRAVLLNDGEDVAEGIPEEVFKKYHLLTTRENA